MNCVKCNAPVLNDNYCSQCGVRADYYKKAYNTANYYYNLGLEKAQVRDLSSAVSDLKIALRYHKELTDARNLLGLIYYEMGEVVLALSEWVVSSHFQPKNNDAVDYLNSVQENPGKLESINQMIKKYNQTLVYARQGNEDLALIQLKKVMTLSPNFVNGNLLMALLYIHSNDYDKARKALKKVLKIDAHNTVAFHYLHEIGEGDTVEKITVVKEKEPSRRERKKEERKNQVNTKPVGKYTEPPSGMFNLVYIAIGMVIAIVVMWFLIIPNKTKNLEAQFKNDQINYSDELASQKAKADTLTEENAALKKEKKNLEKELAQYTGDNSKSNIYDQLFNSVEAYMNNDMIAAAQAIAGVDVKSYQSQAAKDLYTKISETTFTQASNSLYQSGYQKYNNYKYEDALADFQSAYKLNKDNSNALYFMARSYDHLGDSKNASKYYSQVITDFPSTSAARNAQSYLSKLQ